MECLRLVKEMQGRRAGWAIAHPFFGFLLYYVKEVPKSIENLVNVILRCPFYCLPTHILNASYSTKRHFGQQNDAPD